MRWTWRRWLALGLSVPTALAAWLALAGAVADYPVMSPDRLDAAVVASADGEGAPAATVERLALGAFHVHTVASDGRGSLEEVAAAAAAAGLAFVVVTDHNVVPDKPVRIGGVLMIFGVEVSTRDGHVVVLGVEAPLPPAPRSGAEAIAWAEAQGAALAVLAHPVQRKNPWKDADAGARVQGYELYSADTLFRDAMARPLSRLLPAAAGWLGNRRHGVLGLVDDQPAVHAALLTRHGVPVTVCSHDAHGLPPYADVFGTMATAVPARALEGPPEQAAAAVLKSLASGEALCVFQALGDPTGFSRSVPGGGRELSVGQTVTLTLPEAAWARASVRVWGPGVPTDGGRGVVATGEGLLQIEVWVDAPGRLFGRSPKPWLVPTPLRVVQ